MKYRAREVNMKIMTHVSLTNGQKHLVKKAHSGIKKNHWGKSTHSNRRTPASQLKRFYWVIWKTRWTNRGSIRKKIHASCLSRTGTVWVSSDLKLSGVCLWGGFIEGLENEYNRISLDRFKKMSQCWRVAKLS